MSKGIRRYTADSLAGRRMIQAKGAMLVDSRLSTQTPEQKAWNEEVERKRQLKKAKKGKL